MTYRYDLVSVIVHHGSSTSSGHYIAYVKSAAGQWCVADDSRVASVRIEQVLKQQAYMLMYVRREPRLWRLQGAADASAPHATTAAQSSRAARKSKRGTVDGVEQSVYRASQKELRADAVGVHPVPAMNFGPALYRSALTPRARVWCTCDQLSYHILRCRSGRFSA